MGTEQTIDVVVAAFVEKVQVEVGQQQVETVRRNHRAAAVVGFLHPVQAVVPGQGGGLLRLEAHLENIRIGQPLHRPDAIQFHLLGTRHEGAHHGVPAVLVTAEQGERVMGFATLQHGQRIGQFSGHTTSRFR